MFRDCINKITHYITRLFHNIANKWCICKDKTYRCIKKYFSICINSIRTQTEKIKTFHKPRSREPSEQSSKEKKDEKTSKIAQMMDQLWQEIIISNETIEDEVEVKQVILKDDMLKDIVKEMQYGKRQHFCTLAGTKYLIKIIALHQSLKESTNDYTLYICCMDDFIYRYLQGAGLENVVVIPLEEIETEALLDVKSKRTISEYCWTIKSWLADYILEHYQVDDIIYIDSDMYFFSDAKQIYKDWGEASIYLCPQRDLDWVERKYGAFQAGLVGFKNNEIGKKAVKWWKNKCLEWCYSEEEPEMNRWGDQKYLDQLPRLFADAKISGHLGINAAPWNTIYNNNYQITKKEGAVYIEQYPLVAYHFSCIDIFDNNYFDLWNLDGIKIRNTIKNNIYLPYLIAIRKAIDFIEKQLGKKISRCFSDKDKQSAKTPLEYSDFDVKVAKWDHVYYFCSIATEKYTYKIIALHQSIMEKMDNFHLWICCIDKSVFNVLNLLNLKNVTLIPLESIETKEIRKIKGARKTNEFCWTMKSILCSYILSKYNIEKLLYCDADLYFFSHPKEIFDDWQGHSVFLTRQRASGEMERLNGSYQAGLLGFSKDEYSLRVLKWWQDQCLNWCFDNPEPELKRWGDQKYLDQVPLLFTFIKISEHLGINAAPWNMIINTNHHYKIKIENNKTYINNHPLVVYHFGSLLIFNEKEFDLWKLEQLNIDYRIMNYIYMPYIKALQEAVRRVKQLNGHAEKLFDHKDEKKAYKNYVAM